MRKIIAIGKSVLDTIFCDNQPVKSYVGGRIANAASSLALAEIPVNMVSECGDDHVGDIIIDFFKKNKVDVTSIDRYINGSTAISTIFQNEGEETKVVDYGVYPDNRFDVMWPRIDADDIVIFGTLYSIENPQRSRLYEILQYAYDRKALIVYLPGFQSRINYSITKVMPNILENFELSDLVIANNQDIHDMFPKEDGEKAYKNHMIYCQGYMHLNDDHSTTIFTRGKKENHAAAGCAAADTLGWQAGYIAGVVYGLLKNDVKHGAIGSIEPEVWQEIVKQAYEFANECAASGTNCITDGFATQKAEELANALEAK